METAEHGKVVLAAVLAGRKDLLGQALRHLQPSHFTDHVQAGLLQMCERYYDVAGGVLPRAALSDILRAAGVVPGTVLQYEEYYDALREQHPTDGQFRWSLEQLREQSAERLTGEAFAQAMEVLRKGTGEGDKRLYGHKDARSWLLSKLADIDRELHAADAPEGDMRVEGKEIALEYSARRKAITEGGGVAVSTSIPELDEALGGGFERGELDLIAGYTSAGKTSLLSQIGHHAVTQQHRNVVVLTSETLRKQVRIKMIARHSREPQFGLPEGINSRDIKNGTVPRAQLPVFRAVLEDWTANAAYGRYYIAQVPRGATIATIEARLRRLSAQWEADLVIIDYLQLLRADTARRTDREEMANIVREAKQMAATYQDGRGVPVLSPWQMNRTSREAAKGGGGYSLAGLSETSEAPSTADVVLSLLEPDAYRGGRRVELRMQVLKNRDGERGQEIVLDADYATSFYTARTGSSHAGLLGEGE